MGLKQFNRGTATRPILREPDVSTDSLEARRVAAVTRSGRKVARPSSPARPGVVNGVLAGTPVGGSVRLKSGTYNGPVGAS